jgi:predicted TIM-barrel fold metal-dependent hydrolase
MLIYDFNIHLPLLQHGDVNEVISEDRHLTIADLSKAFDAHLPSIKKNAGANFMLFNTNLFNTNAVFSYFDQKVRNAFSACSFTALIDFRRSDVMNYLETVKKSKVKFVMFNSYLQEISDEDFPKVYAVCKFAEENKINICLDSSYGTSKMYTYDNMRLACYIADRVTKVPIVLIHCGGKRIMDAMLLAADKSNVFLDTSFSLPYYLGSSVEMDMAFAFKRLGTNKVVYGSDFPYLNSDKSEQLHLDFFNKYHFSSEDIENMMCKNALALINNG